MIPENSSVLHRLIERAQYIKSRGWGRLDLTVSEWASVTGLLGPELLINPTIDGVPIRVVVKAND